MSANPYDSLRVAVEDHGWENLPAWADIGEDAKQVVFNVLRRLSLARALESEDAVSSISVDVGLRENDALRLHLLLTCIRTIGKHGRSTAHLSFENWVSANGGAQAEELGAAVTGALDQTGGSLSTAESCQEFVSDLSERYAATRESRSHFIEFFEGCVDPEIREWILEKSWVYRDEPVEPWLELQMVSEGYQETQNEELARLTAARAWWDGLPYDERLRWVSRVLELTMTDYTDTQNPFPSTAEKSWADSGSFLAIRDAAVNDRFNLLSDSAFDELLAEGHDSATFHKVDIVLKNDECFVRRSDFRTLQFDKWVEDLSAAQDSGVEDGGEAVFVWNENVALAVQEKPLASHLEYWIENGLKNVVRRSVSHPVEATDIAR